MRSSPPVVFLVLVLLLVVVTAGAPSLSDAAATASVHQQANKQQGHGHGHGGGGSTAAVDRNNNNAFYERVGRFAVMVHCMWSDINPVPKLEGVVSASTRPAKGGGGAVEYLLVLRVAGLGKCRALVWGVPAEGSHDWKLKYFEPVNGGA